MRTKQSFCAEARQVSPPGHILAEIIDQRRLSDNDVLSLCAKLDITARDLCRLLVGSLALDQKLSDRLARWSEVPSNFWLRREAEYRASSETAVERRWSLAECGIV